jgi:glycosyltransferase involved in cell wall biosynthesis
LSKTSSLPEIGEEAASYFNPNNIAQLTTCITTILEDETYKNNLITKGYEQAKKFSWQKMTNEYLETVKEILEH